MLSVLLGETPDLMKQVADFYFPHGARVLDVSFGNGVLVQRLENVTGVDIDPGSAAHVTADSCDLPFDDESFDAAIFDPPYLYGRTRKGLHDRPTWSDERSYNATTGDFHKRAQGTAEELERVLVPGGIAVVKVADARLNGRLVLNHSMVIDAFYEAGLPLRDLLIYVRHGSGLFKNGTSAQGAHGYFIVTEKPTAIELPLAAAAHNTGQSQESKP